jgi:predicted phage terminase large subunit-like protein
MPLSGAIVKTEWLKYYDPGELPSRFSCILQSWDTANKSGELNDFSVCTTWGVTYDSYYLLAVFRRRLNYPDLKRAVQQQAREHHADSILIEDKASGTQLIQDLKTEGIYGIEPYDPPPGSDKTLRLYSQKQNLRAVVCSCHAGPPGLTDTFVSSQRFQAQNMTIRWTLRPKQSIT